MTVGSSSTKPTRETRSASPAAWTSPRTRSANGPCPTNTRWNRSTAAPRRGAAARVRLPVGERGQPVLLAAMDVEHLRLGQPRDEPAQVAHVQDRRDAAREMEGLEPLDSRLLRALNDPRLTALLAHERDVVARAVELDHRPRGPVRIRRTLPTRTAMPHKHVICGWPAIAPTLPPLADC